MTLMASLHRDPRGKSPFFSCAFIHIDGTRAFKSTKKDRRKEASEIARGWQRAVDWARKGELTGARIHQLQSDICEAADAMLPRHRDFVGSVLAEIHERASGERVNFATVDGYLNGWVDSKELTRAKITARRYRDTVKGFLDHLCGKAKRSLSSVTSRDVQSFRDEQLRQGKATKTANMAVKTLRIGFNVACRQGVVLPNPAEAVDFLPENSVERETFTRDQVADLLKVADVESRGMIFVGACHGLRIGDAARLTWANVDMDRKSLRNPMLITLTARSSRQAAPRLRSRCCSRKSASKNWPACSVARAKPPASTPKPCWRLLDLGSAK